MGGAGSSGNRIFARQRGDRRRNVLSGRARRARRPSRQGLRRKRRAGTGRPFRTGRYGRHGSRRLQRTVPDGQRATLRQKGRAGEQGVSGRGRRTDYRAIGAPPGSDHPGGFGALGHFPVPERRAVGRRDSDPDRIGRTFSEPLGRRAPPRDGRRGAGSPELVHGSQSDHRLGLADEQGLRGDRGALAFRSGCRPDRRGDPSRFGRAFDGPVPGRSRQGPDRYARHAPADPVCAHLPAAPAARRQAA